MELTAKEVPAKEKLIDAMHKAGVKVYRRGNLEVVLTVEKEKIKVRLKSDDDAGDDDGVSAARGGGDDDGGVEGTGGDPGGDADDLDADGDPIEE